MSRPNRRHPGSPTPRPRRALQIEAIQRLEDRQVLTPFMTINATTATFTAATTPTNPLLGTVQITEGAPTATSAAGFTSVSQLTPISSFGGDIVRIEAGPGGDFGKGVYAISRGAGSNLGAVNRPGVIYRVDPATGKASVFFDLNTVLSKIEPGGNASNSAGAETGMVNWYDISFDPEGYFDGKTSMFVSSVDRLDPNKNVIFRIGPDGSFLGAYIKFTEGSGAGAFSRMPSAVLVPPPEQQSFLRGLIAGDAGSSGGFVALFFDANQFRPGTDLNTAALPAGVTPTGLFFGPQTGLTSTSTSLDYSSPVYASFADFGTPAGPNIAAQPGLSGVQGFFGDLLINGGQNIVTSYTDTNAATPDTAAAIITPFRRFQDAAYDAYGFFSYGTTTTIAGNTVTFGAIPPTYVGNLFVSDLATGLTVSVAPQAPLPTTALNVPIQGPGPVGVTLDAAGNVVPITNNGNTTGGSNLGGRVVRIAPDGTVSNFAEGFNTSGDQGSQSFIDSSLSITFSADGTTFYAADNDGIWQFKSTLSLAGSTTGSITGLMDLRSLGVPYEGQDSAVAILDTGVDALTPNFRGRIATGRNVLTGGPGNDDPTAAPNGHGTLMAGVVSQFVPQATIQPVNVSQPNLANPVAGLTGVTVTTSQNLYNGLLYINQNPFVKDPIRPNKVDRLISTAIGIGTNASFDTEHVAFRKYPQVVLALKSQLSRMRKLGIQPISAAGEFGVPGGDSTATATTTQGDFNGMSIPAILNESVSVTGTYSFPYAQNALTTPDDPYLGTLPRPIGPVLITGNDAAAAQGSQFVGNLVPLTTPDLVVFTDKLLVAVNRNNYTDYAAPAVNVPTFARTLVGQDGTNVFEEGGTHLSASIVAGSFAVVTSALDYWTKLAQSNDGATADAYLTQPVGARTLTFGSHSLLDLSLYANPDGVNSILEWTAVPVTDAPNAIEDLNQPPLFGNPNFRSYARVDVGNAIAAIEGAVALDYLFAHGTFDVIDGNKDGLITAQEIQTFVDQSKTIGMPEAGAMARLLGGTASTPTQGFQPTASNELPDQPQVLQRRFNFFDYAADGLLNGSVSIEQLNLLRHKILPSPDAFSVTDRQRASINNFLVDPHAGRNTLWLTHMQPKYTWVPPRLARRFANISPARFGVGRRSPIAGTAPLYSQFGQSAATGGIAGGGGAGGGGNNGGGNNGGGNNGGGNNGSGSNSGGSGSTGNAVGGGSSGSKSGGKNQTKDTTSGGGTGSTTGTSTTGTGTTTTTANPAQQFIQAVIAAIQSGKGTTTTPTPQPAGTMTPISESQAAIPAAGSASPTTDTTATGSAAGATEAAAANDTGSTSSPKADATSTTKAAATNPAAQTLASSTAAAQRQAQAAQREARVKELLERRYQARQTHIQRVRAVARYEALHPEKETGWDWVKSRLFNPTKWF